MRRTHYAWVMVAAGFLVLGSAAGQLINCYSLLVVPVCADLGVSRSAMGFSQTLLNTGGVLVPLLAGRIFPRFRLKRLMLVSALGMLAAYFGLSFARGMAEIYALVVALSVFQALVTWMPFSILLNNWFDKKRGLAIGVAFMGSGAMGMVYNALGGALIAGVGWRATIRLYALIAACVIVPILLLVVKEKPEDMGLKPYGYEPDAPASGSERSGASFAEERRGAGLWLLFAGIAAVGFAINSVATTLCAYTEDCGYSGAFAANVTAAYMGALAVGKIALGALYDRIGARRATAACMGALLFCLVCMLLARFPAVLLAGVLLGAGLGSAFGTVSYPNIVRHSYGNRDYGAFTGLLTAANNAGGAFAPVALGAVCDATGSYFGAYVAMAAIVLGFGGLVVRQIPSKPRY